MWLDKPFLNHINWQLVAGSWREGFQQAPNTIGPAVFIWLGCRVGVPGGMQSRDSIGFEMQIG